KGNSLIIRLLPLQGVGLVWRIFTQGVALGYVLLPLRGVLLVSFDTPSPERTPIKNLPRISQMRTDISCWNTLLRKLPQIARMRTD
ncbi:MAG: hypothetical protein SPE27_07010, partial [Prevotella sp.]|nr:hypothetical protein [Prevotella sp.]